MLNIFVYQVSLSLSPFCAHLIFCFKANLISIRQYTCGSDRNINAKSGYLLSPQYPLYPKNGVNCEFNIQKVDGFGFNVYIIVLLLSDPDQNGK